MPPVSLTARIMPMTVVTTGMVTMLPSGAPLSEIVPSLISVALTPTTVAPPLSPPALPVPDTTLPAPPGAGVAGALPPGAGVPGVPGFGAPGTLDAAEPGDDVPAADFCAGAFDFVAAGAEEPPVAAAGAAAVPPAVAAVPA